jgi:hypothetical protein
MYALNKQPSYNRKIRTTTYRKEGNTVIKLNEATYKNQICVVAANII